MLENSFRAEAILIAASAVTATLGMAGFLKWAMMPVSSSVSSSRVQPRATAWAMQAMVRRASPLPVFSCWASSTSVWLWARMASLLVGVVNDANPTSSDAILAQSQTLVLMAQQLNTGNGDALKTIARMAQAIARNVPPQELTPAELDVVPHFKNPAMPSVAVTADAAIKIASVRQEFAATDTFLEMIGFDQADIRRIRAQEQRVRGQAVLTEVEREDTGDILD